MQVLINGLIKDGRRMGSKFLSFKKGNNIGVVDIFFWANLTDIGWGSGRGLLPDRGSLPRCSSARDHI